MGIWEEIKELVNNDNKYNDFVKKTENEIRKKYSNTNNNRMQSSISRDNRLSNIGIKRVSTTRKKAETLPTVKSFLKNRETASRETMQDRKDFTTALRVATLPTAAKIAVSSKLGQTAGNAAGDIVSFAGNIGAGIQGGLQDAFQGGVRTMAQNINSAKKSVNQSTLELLNKRGIQPDKNSLIYKATNIDDTNAGFSGYEEAKRKNSTTKQTLVNSASNNISRKLIDASGEVGAMLPGVVNPTFGAMYFFDKANQNYYDESANRNMTEEQRRTYSNIMGTLESATESIGGFLTRKIFGDITGKGIKSALKTYGVSIGENFAEEALMEPISEATAQIIGGKDSSDWDNMFDRILEAGVNGALISVLMGGISAGIGSANNMYNKIEKGEKITTEDLSSTLNDIQQSGRVNVEEIMSKEIQDTISNIKTSKQLPIGKEITSDELIRGINQRTKKNFVLDTETLPTARAKINNNKITLDHETGELSDIIHETTHYSEGSKGYEALSNHVLTELNKTGELETIKEELRPIYEEQYQKEEREFSENDLNSEVVAKYTKRFIGDELFVEKITRTDRGVAQKIYDWIKDKIKYYKKIVKMDAEQKIEYDSLCKSEKLWEKALKDVTEENSNVQYSIAGKKGMENVIKNNANNITLERLYNRARAMNVNGTDNEIIRQKTNWFQDKNGDWKFEFTDKHMKIKNIKLQGNKTYKLGDILEHDILFTVYPELANYDVKIRKSKANGSFNNKDRAITLNTDISKNKKLTEGTLIHEIQHAIQHLEGFEAGKSSKKSRLAYYKSLGEIEATDTKSRFMKEKYDGKNMSRLAPESSKETPKHPNLDKYLQKRNILDKIKDNYYDKGEANNEIYQEDNSRHTMQNSALVDGRELRGHVNNRKSISSKIKDDSYNYFNRKRGDNTASTAKNNNAPRYSIENTKEEVGGPTRKFYKNVETSKVISDEIKNNLEPKNYRKLTNDESMVTAIAKLNSNLEEESKWRTRDIDKTNSVDVAEGLALLAKYQSEGKYKSALEVIDRLAKIGTKAGQQVQMFAMLQRLTPEGMLMYAKKSLDSALEETAKYKNQKWIDEHKQEYALTTGDEQFIIEHMEKVMKLEDGREKQILLAEIQKLISDKLPPDRGASIKAYMRLSMLFNTKTQIRNILGNALISPVNMVGDTFATIADKTIARKTGVRTKGLTDVKSVAHGAITGAYKSFDDFKRKIDTRNLASDRFEIGNGIRGANFSNKNRFGRAMNSLDRTLSFVLDMGDRPFYESAFLNSINNQMKLNNVPKPTAEMIEIATTEALQRTWQDNNAYTKAVLEIRDILNGKARYGIGDWLIPFAKTPANLTKAIVDYSPLGLGKTLIKDARQLNNAISKNEDVSKYQHRFVDNLGKGMAGSFLYIIGYALAKTGIASGENDEDKDIANFMRNTMGIQPYSIKIGDKSFTYDWAQPIAAPLGIMANIVNATNSKEDIITKAWETLTTASSMLLAQSFMQSISELFNSYNEPLDNLLNVALGLPSRAIPTFLKQIADMVDGTQRTTFNKTSALETAKNKTLAKVPFASKTLAPTVDTFGREIKKYGGDNNWFNVFLNPANTNKGKLTDSAEEIYGLYKKTGDKTIFPRQAPYTELDPYKRAEYQKATGKYADKTIKEILSSKDYKNLNDGEKTKILRSIIDDSNLTAKKEVLHIKSDNKTQAEKAKENGVDLPNMYIYSQIINQIESKKNKDGDTIKGAKQAGMAEYITLMKTTTEQKNKMLSLITDSEIKPNMKDLNTIGLENYTQYFSLSNTKSKENYLKYVSTGMNATELNKYWHNIGKIEGKKDKKGKTISGTEKKAKINYINSLNLSRNEKLLLVGKEYKLTQNDTNSLFDYIKELSAMTTNEKNELIKSLKCFQ